MPSNFRFKKRGALPYVSGDVIVGGDARLDFSQCQVDASNTDGGIIKAGTSSSPVTQDTANFKFVSFYFDDGATSGDSRGIYNRLYITGAGGGGESLRTFTTVSNVAGATAHGAHTSLSFGTSGSLTGLGVAGRNTLHIPNAALGGGTYAAMQAEIYSDGASSNPATATKLSFLRFANDGNATGIAAVEDKAFLFEITGGSSATGNMVYGATVRCDVLGSSKYLILSSAENALTISGIAVTAGAGSFTTMSLSDALTLSDGATIDNTAADTLTITETNIALAGAVSATSLTVGGGYGSTGVTISDAGVIQADGAISSGGAVTGASLTDGTVSIASGSVTGTWADLGTVTTVDIDGGSIDGVTIGANSAGAGTFTNLVASSGGLSVGADGAAGTLTVYPGTSSKGTTTLTMSDNSGNTVTNINVAAQASARTYTVPDAGADAAFLMTDSYKTWWSFAVGLAGEDTDGAGTNGAGLCGGAVDVATNSYNDGGGTVFVKVYDVGDTAWDDLSTSSTLTGWTSNYQLQPDAASEAIGDAFAIGFATKFCEVAFDDLSTGNGAVATYSNDAGKWQYSTGAGTWSDLTVYDGTDSTAQDGLRPLQRSGAISFAPPSDWAAVTLDGQEAYYIQWVFTAAELTQTALIDDTNKDEPFVVVPNADAFDAPFKGTIGKVRVTDMGATVHDQAIKFVVGNFTTGVFTEEFTWAASQYNDTFTPASPLAVAADDRVGILITDDGGSTNNPVIYAEFEATYLN